MSKAIPEISAERFTYELYEPNFWQRLGFEFNTDDDIVIRKAAEMAIGYCNATRLLVRPKDDRMVAIMCEDDEGEKFWFHHYRNAFVWRGEKFEGDEDK